MNTPPLALLGLPRWKDALLPETNTHTVINGDDHLLLDSQLRQIEYLRLSLTASCQMRCMYCRPALRRRREHNAEMTPSEIEIIVRHLIQRHRIHKVRLTGGDPSARPDLIKIIDRLGAIAGLDDLAMTTNGLSLARFARRYADAGLQRVNISLDSLDPKQFARITGVDAMHRVIEGIDAAIDAGLTPLKLNTVVFRGENEHQLPALVKFAADRNVPIRFIELMPMGPLADQWAKRYVPASQMKAHLTDTLITHWQPKPQCADSAQMYRATLDDGRLANIGFITPMSCNFCASCNRLRLAADGAIYPCLMDKPRGSFLSALRPQFDCDAFDHLIQNALTAKADHHPTHGVAVMTTIGG